MTTRRGRLAAVVGLATADTADGSRATFLRDLNLVLRALVQDTTLTVSESQTLRVAAATSGLP